jgi:threonine/homoserine/homoserine lactone efflux protein
VTYIVARSVDQGRTVALASVAGLGLGTMAHVMAASLGLSAFLAFLAFLPQFADPALGAVWPLLLVLGTTFVVLGLCTDGAYALVASHLGRWLRTRPSFARRRRHVTAGIYVTLGVAAALGGSAEAKPTGG